MEIRPDPLLSWPAHRRLGEGGGVFRQPRRQVSEPRAGFRSLWARRPRRANGTVPHAIQRSAKENSLPAPARPAGEDPARSASRPSWLRAPPVWIPAQPKPEAQKRAPPPTRGSREARSLEARQAKRNPTLSLPVDTAALRAPILTVPVHRVSAPLRPPVPAGSGTGSFRRSVRDSRPDPVRLIRVLA